MEKKNEKYEKYKAYEGLLLDKRYVLDHLIGVGGMAVVFRARDLVLNEMTVAEAKEQGAIGLFESKYGEEVKVYTIGDFSKEICGGPHAENTGSMGKFIIQKEQSSSAGVRRIKAVLQK